MDMNGLFVRRERRYERLDPAKVCYVAAGKNGCRVVLHNEVVRLSATLADVERCLDPREFCRVHEDFIVSIGSIQAFDFSFVKVRGEVLPMGEAFVKAFFSQVCVFPEEDGGRGGVSHT
jgi:DNA-binding LytR/AlgR family response regulator